MQIFVGGERSVVTTSVTVSERSLLYVKLVKTTERSLERNFRARGDSARCINLTTVCEKYSFVFNCCFTNREARSGEGVGGGGRAGEGGGGGCDFKIGVTIG